MKLSFKIILLLIVVFSFFVRIYRINQPNKYYFDEVYHVVTARAYAQNNPAAYDPFSPPPEQGTAYDWLHPPLAKLIQAASINILGDNSSAWRLPSVIFGTALVAATFYLGLVTFGPITAIFAALVIGLENLNLVMSRITMNDVFVTFFIVVGFLFGFRYFEKRKTLDIFLCAFLLGLAFASKWTGLYGVIAVFIFLAAANFIQKKLDFKILLIIFIPPVVYLASYSQFWLQGHTISDFVNLHKQIWWYQNRHDLQHSYGTTPIFCVPEGLDGPKAWCPWILNVRGVYFSYEDYGLGNAGYVYALGNPFIFWTGIISASYLLGKFFDLRKKNTSESAGILFILLGYFVFWVPWIFSPRIMFLYHYLPAIPFMAIVLGYTLADIYKTKFKYLSFIIVGIFLAGFLYFYPISTGFPIQIADIERFMWLQTWR